VPMVVIAAQIKNPAPRFWLMLLNDVERLQAASEQQVGLGVSAVS
jgi:hypothetical protein